MMDAFIYPTAIADELQVVARAGQVEQVPDGLLLRGGVLPPLAFEVQDRPVPIAEHAATVDAGGAPRHRRWSSPHRPVATPAPSTLLDPSSPHGRYTHVRTHPDPGRLPAAGIGVVIGVSAAVTRVMALPGVNAWIARFVPWLAPEPKPQPDVPAIIDRSLGQ